MHRRGKTAAAWRMAAVGAAASLMLTGCLSGGDGGEGGGGDSEEGGEGDGSVTILGAFTGEEQGLFEEAVAAFEEDSGIDVQYTGNSDFTTLVRTRVNGGDAPDIALFPQPGLLLDLSQDMVALDDVIDLGSIEPNMVPGLMDAVKSDGATYGVPMRVALKSIVWTPKPAFADGGYQPATSQDALLALTDQVKAAGGTPWCIGMESGAATGWVATDWMEEFVLRIGGPEVYDQWVTHEIPFNDPVIKEAAEAFAALAFPDGNTLGGRQGITNTPFGEAGNPMFENPPGCFMMRQGNFITGFFPDDVQADLDARVQIFGFPPMEDGGEQRVVGGGDLAAMFVNDSDTVEVMEFLGSAEFGAEWAAGGGWLSPRTDFDASNYADETTRQMAEILTGAEVFRFDGSDLMPAAVGAGTFWTGMVDWISGRKDIDTVLNEIEESWPTS